MLLADDETRCPTCAGITSQRDPCPCGEALETLSILAADDDIWWGRLHVPAHLAELVPARDLCCGTGLCHPSMVRRTVEAQAECTARAEAAVAKWRASGDANDEIAAVAACAFALWMGAEPAGDAPQCCCGTTAYGLTVTCMEHATKEAA